LQYREKFSVATSPSAQAAMVEKEAEAGEAAVTKGSGTK